MAEGRGTLLLHLDTDAYHRLNRTGSLIWDGLEGGARTVEELAERLASALGVEPATVRDDVSAYLSHLASRDLVLEEVPEDPP